MPNFEALFPVSAQTITRAQEVAKTGERHEPNKRHDLVAAIAELLSVDINSAGGPCFINFKGNTKCNTMPLAIGLRPKGAFQKLW